MLTGLMKDHGQQARASENFAEPVDFETPGPDLPVAVACLILHYSKMVQSIGEKNVHCSLCDKSTKIGTNFWES